MKDIYGFSATLFNYCSSDDKFYSTLFYGVECQRGLGIQRSIEYEDSTDNCLMLIEYDFDSNSKVTKDGHIFLESDDWQSTVNKSGYFTLQTDKDFFAIGDFLNMSVTSFEDFKNSYPTKSFLINHWNDFEDIIPHFEVFGN